MYRAYTYISTLEHRIDNTLESSETLNSKNVKENLVPSN